MLSQQKQTYHSVASFSSWDFNHTMLLFFSFLFLFLLLSQREAVLGDQSLFLSDGAQRLLWFLLPSEAQENLVGVSSTRPHPLPFTPKKYENTEQSESGMRLLEEQNAHSIDTPENSINMPMNEECESEDSFDKQEMLETKKSMDAVQSGASAVTVKFCHPPKSVFKPAAEAIQDFGMIEDGDRVLLCLSGGKDSLSLLHTLKQFQFMSRAKVSPPTPWLTDCMCKIVAHTHSSLFRHWSDFVIHVVARKRHAADILCI